MRPSMTTSRWGSRSAAWTGGASARGSRSGSSASGSRRWHRARPERSRVARLSERPWRAPWWWSRRSCCWTSPSPPWITRHETLIDDLGRILGEERTTTVLVTHDRAEAMVLGDRVGVLMQGRLLQVDEAAHVFRAPASEEIARFVGVETILDCRVLESAGDLSVLEAGPQRIQVAEPAEPGEWVRLCLRPEDVTLFPGAPKPAGPTALNRLPARV